MLVAEAFFIGGDDARAADLLAFSREHPLSLREQVLESRDAAPSGARSSSATPSTTRCPTSRSSSATAPTRTSRRRSCPRAASSASCTATRALRHPRDPDGVDELDRDALWAFAEGFGYAVERMQMLERLRAQGEEVRALIARTEAIVSEHLAAQVELASAPLGDRGRGARRAAVPPRDATVRRPR